MVAIAALGALGAVDALTAALTPGFGATGLLARGAFLTLARLFFACRLGTSLLVLGLRGFDGLRRSFGRGGLPGFAIATATSPTAAAAAARAAALRARITTLGGLAVERGDLFAFLVLGSGLGAFGEHQVVVTSAPGRLRVCWLRPRRTARSRVPPRRRALP